MLGKNSLLHKLSIPFIILAILSLAACGSPATESTSAPEVTAAPEVTEAPVVGIEYPTGPIELVLWTHTHQPMLDKLAALIPEYTKLHPNVTFVVDSTPLADYTPKLSVALATGTGPDLFNLLDPIAAGYYAKGLLAPYDPAIWGYDSLDRLLEDYLPGSLNGFIFDGQLYGIPNQLNSFSLYTNTQCFTDVGLDASKDYPKTWDELLTIGKDMVKVDDNGRIVREAFDESYNGANWHMFMFSPLIKQFGGEVLGSDGKAAFNGPEGVAALTLWKNLVSQLGDPNLSVSTGAVPNEDFTQGAMCMWQTGPWAEPQIQVNPDVWKNTLVVSEPQVDPENPSTLLYGFAFMLNANSSPEKNYVAQDFVRFAVSDPDSWLRDLLFFQPVADMFNSPVADEIPFFDVFATDMSHGEYMFRSEYFNEIATALSDAIDSVIFDNADPQTALDDAAEKVNQIIGD